MRGVVRRVGVARARLLIIGRLPRAWAFSSRLTLGVEGGLMSSTGAGAPASTNQRRVISLVSIVSFFLSILVSFQVPRAEIFATLQPRSGLPKVGAGRGGVAGAWGDVAARSLTRALRLDKSRDWPAVSGRVARTRATGRSVSASRSSACFSGDTWGQERLLLWPVHRDRRNEARVIQKVRQGFPAFGRCKVDHLDWGNSLVSVLGPVYPNCFKTLQDNALCEACMATEDF